MNEVAELSQNYLVGADSNAVPAGYKQTEVGVIPEDWSLVTLGSIFNFKNGLNKEKHYFGYGTPIVNYMDVYESGGIHCSSVKGLVCVTPVEKKNYSAKRGDVFFTRTSETVEEIGLASVLLDDLRNAVFSGFVLRARQLKETFVPLFMKYCFRHELARKQIQSTASYTTRALTNGNLLSNVYVTVPSKKEQTAIANALSDVDALISELEKLIAKKQAIKTATMQQLLTGRTRLPQFALREDSSSKGTKPSELGEIPEDWEVHSLSSICDVRDGTHDSPKYKDNGIPLVTSKNIVDDILDLSNVSLISPEDAFEIDKRSKVDKGDIIMSMIGTVGSAVLLLDEPKFCIKNVALFKPKKVSGGFLVQLIRSKIFQDYLEDSMDGGIQKFVSLGTLRNMEISLPSEREQAAIATILSDMDTEIQALEQRLGKTRQIKQGMMQELLTGRVRLISGELKMDNGK
ncbi:restriction endonuclease subunit S [Vibrio parahaemolyticus]|uniref:restriction endonuclease subunit S n=1 Tax=Vibrio fluvialis TaxID=676 RepID=UPI0015589BEF|nr:restriction endonuclease subunit S [Vibrio fluvialis]EJG0996696.1 restriction endonuclease subunit S [Vibrio parahaemolyticus]MBY7907146.1 restriction endonuclease subunit S [Vibrio fluvialis]MBY8197029.1 restriction endonuclease subunit S [Vibrio fluvialis]MBY8308691.1 restriction endonuclease subunit S [Vibrio fluvialis]MCE7652343.1 restriction endonuclease subunit S [Vibrio fluvialis]